MLLFLSTWLLISSSFIRYHCGRDKPHPDIMLLAFFLPFILWAIILVYIEIYIEE